MADGKCPGLPLEQRIGSIRDGEVTNLGPAIRSKPLTIQPTRKSDWYGTARPAVADDIGIVRRMCEGGNGVFHDACLSLCDEIERLRAEVSILMYGMEAAWGLLANGQYWDTTDKVRHSEWEHYRNKWRDDYWHPALDRDREARRG